MPANASASSKELPKQGFFGAVKDYLFSPTKDDTEQITQPPDDDIDMSQFHFEEDSPEPINPTNMTPSQLPFSQKLKTAKAREIHSETLNKNKRKKLQNSPSDLSAAQKKNKENPSHSEMDLEL